MCFWVWLATLVTRQAFRRWNRVGHRLAFAAVFCLQSSTWRNLSAWRRSIRLLRQLRSAICCMICCRDLFTAGGMQAVMTPYYWILIKIRAMMARIFSCSGRCTEISPEFYGQRAIFGAFVRNQNAFYGQTAIFRWFVRKFLTIMMRIYGQSRLFGPFVRKTEVETSEFLRTNDHFCPFCP